ncbi:MAG: SIMPL domain-containing protein [Candidatus Eremiobacteraeota bacterium]|nr:SIMPL domain-containing protein [Candidatus Eremiobacteraeota bacterium]
MTALCIVASFAVPAVAATPTAIAVTGNAVVTVQPDMATVNASIATTDSSADAATSQNNSLYERAVNSLTGRGIHRADITLSYYNLSYQPKPQAMPDQPQPAPQNYGYTVTRSFAIKVRKIGDAGPAVDAISPIAGIEVGGVTFDIANSSAARAEATNRAVADARAKAERLAKAAGLHITGIRRIELNGGGNVLPQPMMRMSAISPAREPTNFDAGNVNITADVTAIYLATP